MTDRRTADSAASSATSSSAAMQRVPGARRRRADADRALRRDHEPQLPRRRSPGGRDRYVIRLAGNDTHLLGISREVEHAATVAAAGVGVGPEVTAFIRPEGYLVTRFIEGSPVSDEAVHQAGDAPPGRRLAPPDPRRPGRSRACSSRSGSSRRTAPSPPPAASRSRRSTSVAQAVARRIELACLSNPVELRPCHNDLLNANFIDDGTRIRIVDWEYAGMGDPFFDLGNFTVNHELTPDEDAELLRPPTRATVRPERLARLTLMRTCPTSARRCGASSSRGSAPSTSTSSPMPASTSSGCSRMRRRRPSSERSARRPAAEAARRVAFAACAATLRARYPRRWPTADPRAPGRAARRRLRRDAALLAGGWALIGRAARRSGRLHVRRVPAAHRAGAPARRRGPPRRAASRSGRSARLSRDLRPDRGRRHRRLRAAGREADLRPPPARAPADLHGRRQRLPGRQPGELRQLLRPDVGPRPRSDDPAGGRATTTGSPPTPRGYLDYFGAAAAPQGVTWYSMDLGRRGTSSSSTRTATRSAAATPRRRRASGSPHDLAASTAHCTLAIWHHPRFSSGEHGDDPTVAPFWDALYAASAELVDQRPRPRLRAVRPAGPGGHGGAAARPPRDRRRDRRRRSCGRSRTGRRTASSATPASCGVLRLTLHPANYDWEFLPVDGDIADAGSRPCH